MIAVSVLDSGSVKQLDFFRHGPIAQLVEQLTLNQRVAGSSPARLTIIFNRNDDLRATVCQSPVLFLVSRASKNSSILDSLSNQQVNDG